MKISEIILIAIGVSMDAFAVSVCKGLSLKQLRHKDTLLVGLWFGLFQGLMPLLGYFLGVSFQNQMGKVDHWIAFGLLSIIGGKMIYESFQDGDNEHNGSLDTVTMLLLAIATSIDAFAVGITFAVLPEVPILLAISLIAVTTFLLSAVGVKIGQVFGEGRTALAERFGGAVLMGMGIKILLEHLAII